MSDATRNHDPATCRHLRTSLAFTMGSDVETCLDCGAWNAGSRKNGWHGAPSPSPRDPADDFVRGHAPRCPGIEGGVCDCGGPIGPDKWADLIMEGEAAGCYPCDTCNGFRAQGRPCGTCLAIEKELAAIRKERDESRAELAALRSTEGAAIRLMEAERDEARAERDRLAAALTTHRAHLDAAREAVGASYNTIPHTCHGVAECEACGAIFISMRNRATAAEAREAEAREALRDAATIMEECADESRHLSPTRVALLRKMAAEARAVLGARPGNDATKEE